MGNSKDSAKPKTASTTPHHGKSWFHSCQVFRIYVRFFAINEAKSIFSTYGFAVTALTPDTTNTGAYKITVSSPASTTAAAAIFQNDRRYAPRRRITDKAIHNRIAPA